MKLPGIDYGAPVQDSRRTAGLPGQAFAGAAGAISKGLEVYGKELVRASAQDAESRVLEGLNQAELAIRSREYVSAREIRDTFGDAVPPQVKDRLQVKDPTTGDLVDNERIPIWAVGDSLYQHAAKRLVESAAGDIPGAGWQSEFTAAMRPKIAARAMALAEYHLRGLDAYLQQTRLQTLQRLRSAGEFDEASKVLAVDDVLPPQVRQAEEWKTEVARQAQPALEALMSEDPKTIAGEVARLRGDARARAAIPEEQRRTLVLHLEDRLRKYEATGIASEAFTAGATPGSQVLDETKAFNTLEERLKGRPPPVQHDARELLKARITDFNEQRKNQTAKVFAVALQAFQAPGSDGRPRLSTAVIPSEARAYLTDPANGKEAADLWNELINKERAAQLHDRALAEKPTEQNWAEYAALVKDMQDAPTRYRAMDSNRFTAEVYGKVGPLIREAMALYKSTTATVADVRHLSGDELHAALEALPKEFRPDRYTQPDSEKGRVWAAMQRILGERKEKDWRDEKGPVPQAVLKQWVDEEWAKGTVKGGRLWGLFDASNVPKAVAPIRYPDQPWTPGKGTAPAPPAAAPAPVTISDADRARITARWPKERPPPTDEQLRKVLQRERSAR